MNVKVCNLRSNSFSDDFISSLMGTGFAVVTHHGIDDGLISEMQSGWREFFLKPLEEKNKWVTEDGNMGYKGFKTEKAVGASKADLKEFYHWRAGLDFLPKEIKYMTASMFGQLEDVSGQLLAVLDEVGGTNYRRDCEASMNTILRTIYYPAMDFNAEQGAVRSAAHEDINHITLLVAASAPGLQVKDLKGNWHDVPHEENSIVVNIGDMLQLASGGRFKSTTHRVINPPNNTSDRVSMPLFVHPNGNTVLKEGFTAQRYLEQRLAEIYQKVKS